MGIGDIFKALEEEGQREIDGILSRAREEANQIVEEAEEEARKVKEVQLQKISASIKGEQTRIINDARLYEKKELIRAKEKGINKVFQEAKKNLTQARSKPFYRKVFMSLAREVLNVVEGKVIVSVDEQDERVARGVLDELGIDYELKTDLTCLGGLQVVAAGGRIIHVNTLDSRLEKAKQVLKAQVTSTLFS